MALQQQVRQLQQVRPRSVWLVALGQAQAPRIRQAMEVSAFVSARQNPMKDFR